MCKPMLYDKYTGPIIVICEGNSEYAYIQNINRILRHKNFYGALFKPVSVNTGYFNIVKNKYRSEYKNNSKSSIIIWVDFDLYKRNDKDCMDSYKKKPGPY